MENAKIMTVKEALTDDSVGLHELYAVLNHMAIVDGTGSWNEVNCRDTINMYIKERIDEGVRVSHILEELESSDADYFKIWLGNSMNTPVPIETKEELVEALCLGEKDLETLGDFANMVKA